MNEDSDNNKSNRPADPSINRGGWGYPWGYHIPCFRKADSTEHLCQETQILQCKDGSTYLLNDKVSHFDD